MRLISLLLSILTPSIVAAADYYVSPTGDDGDRGTERAPFKTVQRGIAAAARPGDTIILQAGTYAPGRPIVLGNAGAPGKPITLRAQEGAEVIIDGSNLSADENLIGVSASHIVIQGLTVRNSPASGIAVWGPGSRVHHVEVRDNILHDCVKSGIYSGFNRLTDPVRDLLFESNTIYNCVLMNKGGDGQSWAFAIGTGPSRNVTIRNNLVYQNYGEGVGFYLSDQGLAEGNTVRDNFSVNLYLDNTTNTRVLNNFIYCTGAQEFFRFNKPANGISIANENYGGLSNLSSHNEIRGNILAGNRAAFYCGNYQAGGGLRHTVFAHNTAYGSTSALLAIDPDPGHSDSRIYNNIFYQTARAPLTAISGDSAEIDFSHNLWFSGRPQEIAVSKDDLFENPRFTDPVSQTRDGFQLQPHSPALDAALPEAGKPRANLGAW